MRRTVRDVVTSVGTARVHRLSPTASGLRPLLVLGHGAGAGIEVPDLQAIAGAVVAAGFAVALVEQPWRVGGARLAPRPEILDRAWVDVLAGLRHRGPLVVGGRSAGARVACRTGLRSGAAAVRAISFPLHPPGRPERSRAGELEGAGVPVVVLQGTRDPFGSAEEVAAAAPCVQVVPVTGGDHGLRRVDLAPAAAAAVGFMTRIEE